MGQSLFISAKKTFPTDLNLQCLKRIAKQFYFTCHRTEGENLLSVGTGLERHGHAAAHHRGGHRERLARTGNGNRDVQHWGNNDENVDPALPTCWGDIIDDSDPGEIDFVHLSKILKVKICICYLNSTSFARFQPFVVVILVQGQTKSWNCKFPSI